MRYDEAKFNLAVDRYHRKLKITKGKNIAITLNLKDKSAFFSLAPLTKAAHLCKKSVFISVGRNFCELFNDLWCVHCDDDQNIGSDKIDALADFIEIVDEKAEGKFEKLFHRPEIMLEAGKNGFKGTINLEYKHQWFKPYKSKKLSETCKNILKNCYALKKNETMAIYFITMPKETKEHPLEDYLDSYAISWNMMSAAKKIGNVVMLSYTKRDSMLDPMDKISDLRLTLLGCDICKNSNEQVFKLYKRLKKILGIKDIEIFDAVFATKGKGYPGKHLFGELIGYPSLNKKTRWSNPSSMLYRFDWLPQTKIDKREPQTRLGITDTLPIDIFIESCNVNYNKLRRRNQQIKELLDKSDYIRVIGEETNGFKTDFKVFLKKGKKRRTVKRSDSDVRFKINPEFYKQTKVKAGMFANHPGGEAFVTPEKLIGRFIADVVINIDQSYRLNPRNPLIIDNNNNNKEYKIVKGSKNITKKLKERKDQAWERLMQQARNKSLPQDIISLKMKNFNNIGEFAINTNPKARLCDYLIVNEKIVNMLHIALGSGYEADRETEYHMDMVIDSPRQKLDIYGVKGKKKIWIIKKGEFVV